MGVAAALCAAGHEHGQADGTEPDDGGCRDYRVLRGTIAKSSQSIESDAHHRGQGDADGQDGHDSDKYLRMSGSDHIP